MRTAPQRPRKNEPRGSARSHTVEVDGPKTKKTGAAELLGGLSRNASTADMARLAADKAANTARREAIADGKTPAQVRGATQRARAASIRKSAEQAEVSPDTVRRWVRGTQNAGAQAEQHGRRRIQRSLGGAKGVRAAQVTATSHVNLGKVKVRVDTGTPSGGTEERTIAPDLDPDEMARIGAMIERGDDAGAARAFEKHVLEKYGDGLSGFMRIDDVPGSTTWR